MGKILFAHTRELCYYSGSFFLQKLQQAINAMGVESEYLPVEKEQDWNILEERIGESLDGVVDINSKLPYFVLDDGSPLLDALHAPFFNYIVDHPLYHHPGLAFPLKDYHVLGVDKRHCSYMQCHYPHLKSVTFLPLGATSAIEVRPYEKRRIPLLFSGTYEAEDRVREEFYDLCGSLLSKERAEDLRKLGNDAMERMMAGRGNQEYPLEDILEDLVSRDDLETGRYGTKEFPVLMNYLYLTDKYVRNVRRRMVLETVAGHTALTVIGEGWEQTALGSMSHVTLLGGKRMEESFSLMADSRMVLDVNPLFANGVHDRVVSAMRNGALVCSDMFPDSEEGFWDGKRLLAYQSWNQKGLEEALAVRDSHQAAYMAEQGRIFAEERYSWEAVGRRLVERIQKEKR